MDLRAITDLEGGRLQSDAGSQNEPWDPGVSVTRRQVPPHTPAAPAPPPSAPADGRHYTLTRHKDRGDLMPRVSKGKRSDAEGHPVVSPDHVRNHEDESDLPFVPHHASPADPPVHHPSDPHTAQPAHLSGGHPTSRAAQIVPHSSYRATSDCNRDMGISTTASTQKGLRRERRREDNDTDTVGDRERYRSRPRHRSTEPDPQLNLSVLHSPQKLPPRHRSLPFPPSPDSDSASSQRPTTTELALNSSPGRNLGCDLDRDGPDQLALRCDETRTRPSPTRGEYHPAGVQPAPPQVPSFSRMRSSSIESVEERDEDPSPQTPPQPMQKSINLPTVPPASASAPQPAPNAGNFGMLSDSELADETVHLRALLGCPPGAPVGLNALADPPPGEKPNYPLPTLIKLAIYGSPRRRLTLQEIYQALEDRFEWFRQRTDELSWKNSIRHNLSLRKCFLKVQRPITEPGKGSYWMIDLTQGEGNKRVRKRNKKPTKGQLAAQAAAEAYRASARLPGQGDGPRPAPYPTLPQAHPQLQTAEEDCRDDDDDYQAPPMQTNFATAVNSLPEEQPHHHSLHRGMTTTTQQQPSQPSISSRQLHGQNTAHPLPFSSSHDTLGLNPHVDPTLRPILSKDGLSHHAIGGPVTAVSHYDIRFSRGQSVSGPPQIQQQVSGNPQQAQVTLPQPPSLALAPSHPTYHHQLLSHQGKGPHASTSRAVSTSSNIPQWPQHSPSLLRQQPRMTTSPQQPTAPTQTHLQPTRLPPMRTLCESPVPTTPSLSLQQQPIPPTSSTTQRQHQQGPATATTTSPGFARFASNHDSTGFGTTPFSKSALGGNPPNPMPVIRPLVLSEDKGKRRATESEGHGDSAGDDKREREGRGIGGGDGSRRQFAPLSPRPGIEYVQRADGGLITARRTSGRYDERSVEWLNRFNRGEENRGDDSGTLPPQEDAT